MGSLGGVPGLSNIVAIAGGGLHNLALRNDGTVLGWGDNYHGQLDVPPDLTNAVAIGAGDYHSCALRADGTVVTWGSYSTPGGFVPAFTIPGLSNVVAIAPGSDHDLALLGNGPPVLRVTAGTPAWSNNVFTTWVPTTSGRTYRLESRDSLANGPWFGLPLVPGSGFGELLKDTNAAPVQRFYRVRRW